MDLGWRGIEFKLHMSETVTIPVAVDLHIHLRDPSTNNAETIASGTRAAALGGYALVCDMPNNPGYATWTTQRLAEKRAKAMEGANTLIGFYAGSQPESDNIGELAGMSQLAVGLKLYGAPTTGNDNDYEAADFAPIVYEWHNRAPRKPIMLHAGQDNLTDMIQLVAGDLDHPLHICHVSSSAEVEVVSRAKDEGLSVTCGVCPHHLFKTSHDEFSEGWFARMKPPLAHQDEAEKLFALLSMGEIDVVETDHAPHSLESKWDAERANPEGSTETGHATCFGVPGIEFAVPLLLRQVKLGNLTLGRLIEITSTSPARIIGQSLNRSQATWDMQDYRVDDQAAMAVSGSKWTPYLGKLATGKLESLVINNVPILQAGNPQVLNRPTNPLIN